MKYERERIGFLLRELKAVSDNAGTFEGYVACFSNQDRNGDVIDRGAFTKTLKEAREVKARNSSPYLFPILWQHDEANPIGGFIEAYEDDNGLYVKGQLDLDIAEGQRAYSGLKKGYLRGMSVGYQAVKTFWDVQHRRHITEMRLWEGSPVTFPANEQAQVLAVKSAGGKTDWPLADRDTAWDNDAAHNAIFEKATKADGSLDTDLLKSVHFWYDPEKSDQAGGYKLLFCDVIDGDVKAVPNAIIACTGAHGINAVKGLSNRDESSIQDKISTYYGKMAKAFPEFDGTVPWEKKLVTDHERETKQAGAQAILGGAQYLQGLVCSLGSIVVGLASAAGIALDDGTTVAAPTPSASALLTIDGLEGSIQAIVEAYQELEAQCDALASCLDLPDMDDAPLYMSEMRSALELKAGRMLSASTRATLQKVVDGVSGHMEQVKSLMSAAMPDENDTDNDMDQAIAAGRQRKEPYHSKRTLLDYQNGNGGKPDRSGTTSATASEPDTATLAEFDQLLTVQKFDLMR